MFATLLLSLVPLAPPASAVVDDAKEIAKLVKDAKSRDASTRSAGISGLTGFGREGARALAGIVAEENDETFYTALKSLERMGTHAGAALPEIIAITGGHATANVVHLDHSDALAVVAALGGLIDQGKHKDLSKKERKEYEIERRRKQAWTSLRLIGKRDLAGFRDAVLAAGGPESEPGSSYSDLRLAFGQAVSEAGAKALPVVGRLIAAEEPREVALGVVALFEMKPEESDRYRDSLLVLADHAHEPIRWRAAEVLAKVGDCASSEAMLRQLLTDVSLRVQIRAAWSLNELCQDLASTEAVALHVLAKADHAGERQVAIDLLAKHPNPSAAVVEAFVATLGDASGYARWKALLALERSGADMKKQKKRLKKLVKDKDARVARDATRILEAL